MRPQETDKIVRLDAPGLGAWADARHFRRAGLVLMKQGAWANNYRSDVKVFNMQGKMVRPTDGEAAFKEMYETAQDAMNPDYEMFIYVDGYEDSEGGWQQGSGALPDVPMAPFD